MKQIMLAITLCALATPALAISRYQSQSMTCEEARNVLRSEGAAILRYPSKKVANLMLYDRYVKNSNYCDRGEFADWTRIPTSDNKACRVLACKELPRRHDRDREFPVFLAPQNAL